MAADQAAYVQGLAAQLPAQYRDIKALVYFDAAGPAGSWALTTEGMRAFAELLKDPYFSYRAVSPGAAPAGAQSSG